MKPELCECGRVVTHQYTVLGWTGEGNVVAHTLRVCEACLQMEREMSHTGILPDVQRVPTITPSERIHLYLQGRDGATIGEIAESVGISTKRVRRIVNRQGRFVRSRELLQTRDLAQREVVVVRVSTDPNPGQDA